MILVARGHQSRIRERLHALQGVSVPIVVDNGSGETEGFEEEFPQVRFIRLPRDFGLTKALNLGIRAATADRVMLLSPDVTITAETIEALAGVLDEEAGVGAVCPLLVGPGGSPTAQVSELPSRSQPNPPLRPAQAGEHPARATVDAIMFRAFFLRALRQIDERYGEYGSSIELSRQVMRANKSILIHPRATAVMEQAPPATTNAQEVDREVGTFRYLAKHAGFLAGVGYLAQRVLAALFSFRFGKVAALVGLKKIDGN